MYFFLNGKMHPYYIPFFSEIRHKKAEYIYFIPPGKFQMEFTPGKSVN